MSTAASQVFSQSEATAAERRMLFHLTNTADGSNATGKAIAGADFVISKNGAAFANAAGVVTELASGWYQMEFAAADLDTKGALACLVTEAGCDPVRVVHRVQSFDQYANQVSLVDGSLTAAKLSSDALAAISAPTQTTTKGFTLSANGNVATSMDQAVDVNVEATGTWDGGSLQVQTTEDPGAAVPVWTNRGAAITANGTVTVQGPHNAVRAVLTGATTPDLAVNFVIRKRA